ncbi:MAG: site-specific integrase [Turicibacter sp.]|nr:site-specific integrase [Turicibacter sp.]
MAKRGENIYKRKDGRWEARVIKGYNALGKPVYAYFYAYSYKDVKDKMFASLLYVAPTISFGILLDNWLENSQIRLKESSFVKYHNLINKHIKPILGNRPLSEITNAAISEFVANKLKITENPQPLSLQTVKILLSIIKSALRFAQNESLIANVNINVTLPKEKPSNMRVLSIDEQTVLEKYLCADMDESKLGVYLCLYTGLRIGEVCALLWSDISLNSGVLTVNRTMQRIQIIGNSDTRTKIITTDPKSNFSARTIPLPQCLIDKLQEFRPKSDINDRYLLTGQINKYIEPRTLQNRLKYYLSHCGVKNANFHALRHTFATRCVALGFEIKTLSEILGHSNVHTTLDTYVHPSFDMKRCNMEKLTALF